MSKRVLIADDSLTIQRAFAMSFAGEDLTLLAARSADEGLTMARQAHPDLVIADAVMPGRSGYDLAQAIKSDPSLRGVPVYILASSHNPYDEGRGRQSGVDGTFTKPFESVVLLERIREAIAKGTTAAVPAAAARAPLAAVPVAPAGRALDEDYGEISIDAAAAGRGDPASEITPPPREASPQRAAPPAAAPASASAAPPGLRPSLIPGLRPGAAPPPSRPGMTMSPRPAAGAGAGQQPPSLFPPVGHATSPVAPAPYAPPGSAPGSGVRPPLPQTATATPSPARTLVGLPATLANAQQRLGVPSAPARPPTQPVRPLEGRTPAPYPHPVGMPPGAAPRLESQVDQKIAQIAARGAEYEAIAKLSREIIEKIVWEVVPELAEVIVREELQKRGRI